MALIRALHRRTCAHQTAARYEGGIRTPTIINRRGRLAPGRMEHPVHIVDGMPTLTALVGVRHREDPRYDRVDIWPLIAGQQSAPAHRSLFWKSKGGAVLGVRGSGWKLISQQEAAKQRTELCVSASRCDLAADRLGQPRW